MRYLDLLTALFATVLLVSNVASTKLVVLGPFTFDGGTLLFPLAYIFGDVLTEVYGYRKSRRVIWIGFFALLLATLTFQAVAHLPAPPDAESQRFGEAFGLLLGLTLSFLLVGKVYWDGHPLLLPVVGVSLVLIVFFANLVGAMLPFLLRRLGVDPALVSNPLVATLSDVTGLLIYLSVARLLLEAV